MLLTGVLSMSLYIKDNTSKFISIEEIKDNRAMAFYIEKDGTYEPINTFPTSGYKLNEDIISLNVYIGESKAWRSNLYPSLKSLPNIDLKVYVSEQFYNLVTNGDEEKNIFEQRGNVVYYLDEETTFFVDDVDKAKVNVVPPIPYKEGYTFDGWYKDLDYIEEWDFDKDLVPEKIYNEEGNYQFIETKIYAKWK